MRPNLSTSIGVLLFLAFATGVVYFTIYAKQVGGNVAQITERSSLITERLQDETELSNQTDFQIVRIESDDKANAYRLVLKNNYSKSINSFHLTIDETSHNQIELAYSGVRAKVAPGEEFVFTKPLRADDFPKKLDMKAVYFTDGTGDGEETYIYEIADKRRGEKLQMQRGLALLENVSASSQVGISEHLSSVEQHLSSLPLKDEKESLSFNSGLRSGYQRLELDLKQLSHDINSLNNASSVKAPSTMKTPPAADSYTQVENMKSKLKKIISTL